MSVLTETLLCPPSQEFLFGKMAGPKRALTPCDLCDFYTPEEKKEFCMARVENRLSR